VRIITNLKSALTTTGISICLAVLTASTGWAELLLEAETNPSPINPSQLLDAQITVSNSADSASGSLTLRVLWPEELNITPVITGGGNCPSNCDPGDYLSWNLGVLGPATSVTVSFNETVRNATADGALILLDIELLENAIEVESLNFSTEVQSDSPLELTVDPLTDPVASGATLVYEIVYGNAGAADVENGVLSFPIPVGTQFQSASGGGVFSAGNVNWNLGNLVPNSGGRERVTVQVDGLADGSLLLVDAATLSGDVNFLPIESRAMAVSRVGPGLLELDLEINPDPVAQNELMDAQITVSNPTGSAT